MTKVFYSWQSDLPNNTNRGLIGDALERAAKAIRDDDRLEVDPVIDRDTAGVAGAPDISATIFAKIDQAAAFVCDVSIVNRDSARPTPNPNVLVELGWAAKSIGWSRITMICNLAYGTIEQLPFDLRGKKIIPYTLRADELQKSPVRSRLTAALESALRTMLTEPSHLTKTPLSNAIEGVEMDKADVEARIVDYTKWLSEQMARSNPTVSTGKSSDDDLVAALQETVEMTADFARLCGIISRHRANAAALALVSGFAAILQFYNVPPRGAGTFRATDFDFYRFLGHEYFVMLIAALLGHGRLDLLAQVLDVHHVIETNHGSTNWPWSRLSQYCPSFAERKKRLRLDVYSAHAALLRERHGSTPLAELVPFDKFMEADYFLFLSSVLHSDVKPLSPGAGHWRPWSLAYMQWVQPTFLVRAERRAYAEQLLSIWKLADISVLRDRLQERATSFATIFDSFGVTVQGVMDLASIASKA